MSTVCHCHYKLLFLQPVGLSGKTFITSSVHKDGHKFFVHLVDPCDTEVDELLFTNLEEGISPSETHNSSDTTEKADLEQSEKDSGTPHFDNVFLTFSLLFLFSEKPTLTTSSESQDKQCHSLFGSWVANLCDGMTLSMSSHGDMGKCKTAGRTEERILQLIGDIPSTSSPSPVPQGMESPKGKKGKAKSPRGRSPRGKSPKGKKKGEPEKDAEAQKLEEQRMQVGWMLMRTCVARLIKNIQ